MLTTERKVTMSGEVTYKLWENEIPGSYEYEPEITYYPSLVKITKSTAVIFPGGGYGMLASHEGEGYARYLNTIGMDAFVVKNRVSPCRFPLPLLDARRAVRFVRANFDKFGIDKDRVAVMGSSAGGHLAALLSTFRGKFDTEGADIIDKEDYLPNAQILCYPVICMADEKITHMGSNLNLLGKDYSQDTARAVSPDLIADEETPTAFIWHTAEDKSVNVINSYRYAAALHDKNIPVELIVYPYGHHGEGLAPGFALNRGWTSELFNWLNYIGYIDTNN